MLFIWYHSDSETLIPILLLDLVQDLSKLLCLSFPTIKWGYWHQHNFRKGLKTDTDIKRWLWRISCCHIAFSVPQFAIAMKKITIQYISAYRCRQAVLQAPWALPEARRDPNKEQKRATPPLTLLSCSCSHGGAWCPGLASLTPSLP